MEQFPENQEQQPQVYSHDDCNAMMKIITDVIEREYNDGGICGLTVQSNSWEDGARVVFTIKNEDYYPTLVHILQEYMPDDMIRQTRIYLRQR